MLSINNVDFAHKLTHGLLSLGQWMKLTYMYNFENYIYISGSK
ncbi:unnamed protein product [Spirodela intermedia]|uniref:Uncharacterized protein n=1 Tax=Spirodela intermedia TaxID=51605 RepID=A0A7I8KR05_SPIIN|nr:unnamed protein product [Spirodela intermedia]